MNSQMVRKVDILGVAVACLTRDELFRSVIDWAGGRQQRLICYVNAHVLNTAAHDQHLKTILNQADLVYADGISIAWASEFLYQTKLEKLTARAWIQGFAQEAEDNKARIFMFGGKPGISRKASAQLQQLHPGLEIAGVAAGYFSPEEERSLIDRINRAKTDILFVGLGSPRQEKWIHSHRQELEVPVIWGIGALFDYLAGSEKPVPAWLDRLGMEWLWRLKLNPRQKWKRYLFGNPLFVWRVIHQKYQTRR